MSRAARIALTGWSVLVTASLLYTQNATLPVTMSLKTYDNCTVPWQNGKPVPTFEKQSRPTIGLAGTWKRQRFSANHILSLARRDGTTMGVMNTEAAGRQTVAYADTAWDTKTLPAVENTMNAYETCPEFYENGVWYRRTFTVPDSLKGKAATLKFLAVNYIADVWVNGVWIGCHEGGYTPFAFDVSSVLRTDTVNVIAVRVDNIPWNPGHTANISANQRIDIVPYYKVDWFNYTGIIHDVYLEFSDPVSVVRADVVPQSVNGTVKTTVVLRNDRASDRPVKAEVFVYEAVVNDATIQSERASALIGAPVALGGQTSVMLTVPAGSVKAWRTTVTVPNPKLWSPHGPNLYIMKVRLTSGDTLLDEYATQFGIRTIQIAGSAVLLNGREMYYPGVARHEDHATYGRSVPLNVIYNDLKIVKSLNAAFLRTAHYPNNPYTYLIADRLGIAVMEEVPVFWFDTDNAWSIQNTMRYVHLQMWREMIFKDYNRPSVMFWSTCNECLIQTGRQTWIAMARTDLRDNYFDGRLVTQSAAADRPGPNDYTQGSCDVAGWTMYFGIFHGSSYLEGTRQFLQNARVDNVNKPILDTEFGIWSGESMGGVTLQAKVLDSTFTAFSGFTIRNQYGVLNPSGCLIGTTWWCVFDWYSCQNPGGFQSMGVYRMDHASPKNIIAAKLAEMYKPYYDSMELVSGVENGQQQTPASFRLAKNYPNPFNPSTTIRYTIPASAHVRLRVYDILGREAAVLADGERSAGDHAVVWNASGFPSGVYLCTISVGGSTASMKMLLVK